MVRQTAACRYQLEAVSDDVELNAEEIERLASGARPLVESKGQWIGVR